MLCVLVAMARGVFWAIEQPGSSKMPLFPAVACLRKYDDADDVEQKQAALLKTGGCSLLFVHDLVVIVFAIFHKHKTLTFSNVACLL
jgi:hypothetical protein